MAAVWLLGAGMVWANGPVKIESGLDGAANSKLVLQGRESRWQLLAAMSGVDGAVSDVTRSVKWSVEPKGVVEVDRGGMVVAKGDGAARIRSTLEGTSSAEIEVEVRGAGEVKQVHFSNQIVPIFTKAGCNGGGCHGKASGQNGFRLSLLGFEPDEDYEHLVKEARGRRLFPAAPERSLLLLKAVGEMPHGGGKRLEPGSLDYELIRRWIGQGMPQGSTNDPSVALIEVYPKQRTMKAEGEQQLRVIAKYTDGTIEDVTHSALYEANDKEMARVDEQGHVKVFKQPGTVAIMVRYQSKVAVFQGLVPLGAPVEKMPAERNLVDKHVFKRLRQLGLPPSELADDSVFLRRSALDIAGRIPSREETEAFLADSSAEKRDRWIEKLLESPEYAEFFANKWAALLRNKRAAPTHARGNFAFHGWIRDSLMENRPYDHMVREVLTATGTIEDNPPVAWYRQVRDTTAQLEDTAQLFMGLRLQCAQCHHHPYEKWSQHDYFSLAAFYSRVGRKAGNAPGEEMIVHKRGQAEAVNKKTKKGVKPAGLGESPVSVAPDEDPRAALAGWLTDNRNPFFAKSLVNRYWKHFFNRGLVDPEDDLRETNPPSNPELLDALADHFVSSGYDLRSLVRLIATSSAYQLSAVPNAHNATDRQNFSRYYPKRLPAEVLFDAVHVVAGASHRFEGMPEGMRAVALPDNSFNASTYFLTVFGRPESSSACECERSQDASLAQSLHLLNAKELQDKIASEKGKAARLAADTTRSDPSKIQELYQTAFARAPLPDELATAQKYLDRKTAGKSGTDLAAARRQAYEDMVWACLNTKEFLFNH